MGVVLAPQCMQKRAPLSLGFPQDGHSTVPRALAWFPADDPPGGGWL